MFEPKGNAIYIIIFFYKKNDKKNPIITEIPFTLSADFLSSRQTPVRQPNPLASSIPQPRPPTNPHHLYPERKTLAAVLAPPFLYLLVYLQTEPP